MSKKEISDQRAPADRKFVPKIATTQLMKGQREVIIQHGSEEYRLRITSSGKLILTK